MKKFVPVLGILLVLLAGCVQLPLPKDCYPPCHVDLGYDYTANPPSCSEDTQVCTMDYRAGDACLVHIDCRTMGGECETIVDPRFYECVSCFRQCMDENRTMSECNLECV